MSKLDPKRLQFGPYKPPPVPRDKILWCERFGEVKFIRLSDGPIPWPIGQHGRTRTLVLCGDLAKAVKLESNLAVANWWGVTAQTVTLWRKTLGVKATPGTSKLRREYGTLNINKVGPAMWAEAQSPIRRRKIAQAKRGKPRPAHVMEAVRKSNLGRKATPEARANMSAAQKHRGVIPPAAGVPWTASEDKILRSRKPAAAANLTGRTLSAVYQRRHALGLSDGRTTRHKSDS